MKNNLKYVFLVKAVCARKFGNSTLPVYVGIKPDVYFMVLIHVEYLTIEGKVQPRVLLECCLRPKLLEFVLNLYRSLI